MSAFDEPVEGMQPEVLVARDDTVTMSPHASRLIVNAKANDFSLDRAPFAITRIVSVSAGWASIDHGMVVYDKPDDRASIQTIVYEISNARGATSQATITVKIKADDEADDD